MLLTENAGISVDSHVVQWLTTDREVIIYSIYIIYIYIYIYNVSMFTFCKTLCLLFLSFDAL